MYFLLTSAYPDAVLQSPLSFLRHTSLFLCRPSILTTFWLAVFSNLLLPLALLPLSLSVSHAFLCLLLSLWCDMTSFSVLKDFSVVFVFPHLYAPVTCTVTSISTHISLPSFVGPAPLDAVSVMFRFHSPFRRTLVSSCYLRRQDRASW